MIYARNSLYYLEWWKQETFEEQDMGQCLGCHGQQPISHRESSDSNPDQSEWYLRCTKWHWEEVSLRVLQFPPVDMIPTKLYRHHTVSGVRVLVKDVKTKAGSTFRKQNVKCSTLRLFCDVR